MLKKLPEDFHFIFLGGPEDHFIQKIIALNPSRLHNFAGKLSLTESAKVIEQSELTISNDTGLLHVAEQLGRPAIALMGPAPFGYPSRQSTQILELQLECKPCSKHGQGPCVNAKYHECLRGISPQLVEQHALKKLAL
jgi:ADP-heptose:LPS heptosyltransferase